MGRESSGRGRAGAIDEHGPVWIGSVDVAGYARRLSRPW